jgi:hypothetical protein
MGMMIAPKIKDCLPLINGIWYYIDYQFPEVFDIDSSQLDIMFMSNWSMRTAAPILKLIHQDEDTNMLTPVELLQLSSVLKGMFKNKWDKMMNVAILEYDPIHNYHDHMIEEIEYGEEVDRTKTGTGSNSNTRTDNLSEVATDARQIQDTRNLSNTGSNSNQNNVYGFNSSTAVGESNNSGNNSMLENGTITTAHSGNLTTTNTGTQTDSGSNSYSETGGDDTSGTRNREYTKEGNIGNISTQKLLKEELDLWKYNFLLEMMRDVANVVSLPIYEQ